MAIYDKIGAGYNKTRKADLRIFNKIFDLLGRPQNMKIIDVGAGTGNYSLLFAEQGNQVIGLEPSVEMINQNKKIENVEWIKGYAEEIVLESNFCDKAICILSIHHFSDLKKSFQEIYKVLKNNGELLIYTYIPQEQNYFWLEEYYPKLFTIDRNKFLDEIRLKEFLCECGFKVINFEKYELHYNLQDNFLAANWRKPEKYLEEEIRAGISTFSLLEIEEITEGNKKLQNDLKSGNWMKKYGEIVENEYFDAGYRILKMVKA